jgi:hypothetical protein
METLAGTGALNFARIDDDALLALMPRIVPPAWKSDRRARWTPGARGDPSEELLSRLWRRLAAVRAGGGGLAKFERWTLLPVVARVSSADDDDADADADADAARALVLIVVFGPTHVGAAAGGGRGAGRGSSSSSSSELNRISRASLVGTRGDATGGRPGRRAAKSRSESSSSDSVKSAEVSLSSESTPMAF